MIALALCLLKAYKMAATAVTDKTPTMARTASISIILLPNCDTIGRAETVRARGAAG